MKVKDLKPNPKNPRTITDAKLAQLKAALTEFGDLSGIVFNTTTQQLVGGHQRRQALDAASTIKITKTYDKPTKSGTVAVGYILLNGERLTYREVKWDKHREMAANLAANKGAGEWDLPELAEWMKELGRFDVGIDLDLTMFDEAERFDFGDILVGEHTRLAAGDGPAKDLPPAKCKAGQVYRLGDSKLIVGAEELHFCDTIISRWEKYSSQRARLQPPKTILRKTATQSTHNHAKG